MFAADGPDVSRLGQRDFDWSAAAGCTTRRFASARISHGPYTDRNGVVQPGFIDRDAAANRDGMIANGFARRVWYTIVTPLATAAFQAGQVQQWVANNGGLPPGEAIAIDWEGNPNVEGEVADVDLVLTLWQMLAVLYGPDRVGFYGSRGYLDQLPDARGFRWLASYTDDAFDAAVERGCAVVQWTSSYECPGWDGRLDMNEIVDAPALERACGIPEVTVATPQGSLDVVEPIYDGGRWTGQVRVAGWAYDPDTPGLSTQAHIYIDGALAAVVDANRARADVNAALGVNGDYGYDAVVVVPRVTIRVDAYGIDTGGQANALIGQMVPVIPTAG